jgi:hypothetical protein
MSKNLEKPTSLISFKDHKPHHKTTGRQLEIFEERTIQRTKGWKREGQTATTVKNNNNETHLQHTFFL